MSMYDEGNDKYAKTGLVYFWTYNDP